MRKLFFILFVILSGFGYSATGVIDTLFNSESLDNTLETVYSTVIPVKSSGYFGLWYKVTSAGGTPNIRIFPQMSYDNVAGDSLETATAVTTNFVQPVGINDVEGGLTYECIKVKSLYLTPMSYFRIGIKNTGDTKETITMKLFRQEI